MENNMMILSNYLNNLTEDQRKEILNKSVCYIIKTLKENEN